MTRLCAAVPAYNEGDRIGDTVRSLLTVPDIDTVLVIDDGSRDNTAEMAEKAGAEVVRLSENKGKGNAMNTARKSVDAEFYLFVDADLGECAEHTEVLIPPVIDGEVDMTIALMKAPPGHKGGFGAVKKLAAWGIKKFGGINVAAPISGQRCMTRELIDAIGGFEKGFGVETAMTIDAARKGFKIREIPVELNHRLSGRSIKGFLHRGRQFMEIARAIAKRVK